MQLKIQHAFMTVALLFAMLLGFASVRTARGGENTAAKQDVSVNPFVIKYTYYKLNGTGPAHEVVTKVASNGKVKLMHYWPENGVMVAWDGSPEAQSWQHPAISSDAWANYSDLHLLKSSEGFAGTNKVLDYEVNIIRTEFPGGITFEEWFHPQFGPVPLKSIEIAPDGTFIMEATSVELRDVALSEVE
jgi:hypothetical protein